MCLTRKDGQRPDRVLGLGAMFAGAVGASLSMLPRFSGVSESWADGLSGLLVGVAIGLICVGIWRRGRG